MPRFLAAADVYVSPSAKRRLGSGIIEAWAQARPVIAISAGRSAELIDHGRTGVLVPPEGSAELAQAIAAVVENRPTALQIALAGRQAFEAGYAPAAVLEAHAQLVERLAADADTPLGSSR